MILQFQVVRFNQTIMHFSKQQVGV